MIYRLVKWDPQILRLTSLGEDKEFPIEFDKGDHIEHEAVMYTVVALVWRADSDVDALVFVTETAPTVLHLIRHLGTLSEIN